MIKKIISFILIILISFSNFAAVVSDNDGSAFVTKAEYDSIKSDFKKKVEEFNGGIDNKINDSIAKYLAGIKTATKTTHDLMLKTDDLHNVNFMNGTITTDYKLPNSKIILDVTISSKNVANKAYGGIHVTRALKYDNGLLGSNTKNRKYLFKLKENEIEGNVTAYVWDGIAEQYIEYINTTLSCYGAFEWVNGFDTGGSDNVTNHHTVRFDYPTCITGTGYNASIRDQILNNNFKVFYTNDASNPNVTFENWDDKYSTNNIYAKLGKINKVEKTHECVISYTTDAVYRGHLQTSTNTLDQDFFNPLTDEDLFNSSETLLNTGVHVAYEASANMYDNNKYCAVTPTSTAETGDYTLGTVGYLGEYFTENILLYDGTLSKTYTTNWTLSGTKIYNGLPVFAGRKGEKIDWTAKFDNVVCFNAAPNGDTTNNSSGTNYSTNVNEVDIYLAYMPFDNRLTTRIPDNFVKWIVDGVEQNYITTKDREKKISFTLDKDGIIYMKAIPHFEDGSYDGLEDFWDLELNIDDSYGRFSIEKYE